MTENEDCEVWIEWEDSEFYRLLNINLLQKQDGLWYDIHVKRMKDNKLNWIQMKPTTDFYSMVNDWILQNVKGSLLVLTFDKGAFHWERTTIEEWKKHPHSGKVFMERDRQNLGRYVT